MKKLAIMLSLSVLILQMSITVSASTSTDTKSKEDNYDTLTLVKEKYDGYNLIRYYQDKDKKPYVYFLELPSFLQKKINAKDKDAVGEVITELAKYYGNSKVDNLEKLNVLFYQFIPEYPYSNTAVSKDISNTVSSNLNEAIKTLKSNQSMDLSQKQISELKVSSADEKFQKEYMPYQTQNKLIKATEDFSNGIETKWYKNIFFYIVSGVVILLISGLFIVFKRR